jgi:hypothetical protein
MKIFVRIGALNPSGGKMQYRNFVPNFCSATARPSQNHVQAQMPGRPPAGEELTMKLAKGEPSKKKTHRRASALAVPQKEEFDGRPVSVIS